MPRRGMPLRDKHAIPDDEAMSNLDDYPEERPKLKPGQHRGPSFRMSNEHRTKIANSQILKCLIEHAEGKRNMSGSQVNAGLGLLKKVLPDLSRQEQTGPDGAPIQHAVSMIERRIVDPKGNGDQG